MEFQKCLDATEPIPYSRILTIVKQEVTREQPRTPWSCFFLQESTADDPFFSKTLNNAEAAPPPPPPVMPFLFDRNLLQ